jgi:hypothetical protein
LEVSGRGVMGILSLHFPEETKRTTKAVVKMVGVLANIRTAHPQKTRVKRCTKVHIRKCSLLTTVPTEAFSVKETFKSVIRLEIHWLVHKAHTYMQLTHCCFTPDAWVKTIKKTAMQQDRDSGAGWLQSSASRPVPV